MTIDLNLCVNSTHDSWLGLRSTGTGGVGTIYRGSAPFRQRQIDLPDGSRVLCFVRGIRREVRATVANLSVTVLPPCRVG
jgi:hypothetical protein